jgi:hypothetical protein
MGLNLGWVLCVACVALLPAERDWVLPCVDPTFVGRGRTAAPLVVDFGGTLRVRWIELRVLDRAPGTKPVGFSSIELQAR